METGLRYRFGPFLLDPGKRILLRDEQEILLYGKAFDTLFLLVRNSDRLIKKDELLREVWANRVVEENNLSQSISAARKALDDTAQPHTYIVTVPAWGYRFAAPVSVLAEPARSLESMAEGSPEPLAVPVIPSTPSLRSGRLARMTLVLVAVLLCVGLLRSRFGSAIFARSQLKTVAAAPVRARRSVAIVGFQNLSGQKEDEWLSTALAEMLNTELAAGEQLRVVSQEDVARVKAELSLSNAAGVPKSMGSGIGRSLGSDLLVSGVYSIVGDKGNKQVRFDVRLQNGNSGETVAEIAETGSQTELFGLVSQAGARLRQKLNISGLSPTETLVVRASLPKDGDAARLYAEGLTKLRMFDAIGATERLEKAIALDPDYALAHSALAEAWSVLGYDAKSRDEAEKAFQHSGSLSRQDQLSVEGQYRMASTDWAKAVEVYKTLFVLFPDDLDYGLHLASAQTKVLATDDAFATLKALRRLPAPAGNDPRVGLTEYEAWRSLGDFKHREDAVAQAAEIAKQQGKLLLLARARTGQCAMQRIRGEQEQALKNCRESQQILAAAGDRRGEAEVLRVLGDIMSESDTGAAVGYYERALHLEQEIGHLAGQAAVMTQLATARSSQGDHLAAKRSYEKAQAILQQLGEKEDATGLMIDVGAELAALGQVEQAAKIYRDVLELASAQGNKYTEAMAESNIGVLQQQEGDLQGAQESFTQAGGRLQQVGSKEYEIDLARHLGELAMARGDFTGARALYEKAMSMEQASKQKLSAAETEMDLDELAMEEGRQCVGFEKSVRRLVDVFGTGSEMSGINVLDDQASAVALLARCQLSQGQSAAALQTIERAAKISAKADPSVRLSVAVAAARIRFAAGSRHDESRVANELAKAITEARKLHYFSAELEGRLALGELEVHCGALSRGRTRLQSVEKDASRHGFALLARKARVAA